MTLCACQLKIPALMVTAGKDEILVPALSKGMEDLVSKAEKQQHDSQSPPDNRRWTCMRLFSDRRSRTWAEDTSRSVDTGLRWKGPQRPTESWYRGWKKHTRRPEESLRRPNCEGRRKSGSLCVEFEQNKTFILPLASFLLRLKLEQQRRWLRPTSIEEFHFNVFGSDAENAGSFKQSQEEKKCREGKSYLKIHLKKKRCMKTKHP